MDVPPLTVKRALILLMLAVSAASCRGSDGVSIIRTSDGKVVGRDSPKGEYRDMVLGCDEATGKLAIIEWGQHKSTIKIFDVTAGIFKKHTVPVGRLNGIDGAEYYDFASDEYVCHDRQGIHFFGKTSQQRDVANPLPAGYCSGTMVGCRDGLLILCGNAVGDYRGAVVYRYLQPAGSVKAIYRTSEGVRKLSAEGDSAIIVEDIQADYKSRQLVRIDLDGKVLSRATMPMHTADGIKVANGTLYEVYGDGACHLRQASLDRGTVLREIQFAGVSGDITRFDVKGDVLVVGERMSRDNSRGLSATILDVQTQQVRKRFQDQWAWSDVMLMKFNGEVYCILSN